MSDNNKEGPVTTEDIRNVQQNWALIKSEWKKVGVAFFMKLFKDNPNIKAFFKMFNNMSWEEIESSKKLSAHAINFRLGVSSYIDNLDDLETVKILINRTAANHFKRQIQAVHFRTALKCYVEFLEASGKADKETLGSWGRVLHLVGDVIEESMKELEAETDGE